MKALTPVQSLFSFLFILLFSNSSFATLNNPQIRICHQLGGTFFVAESADDEIGFCQFDASVIGTLDLLQLKNESQKVHSIENYENQVPRCSPWGQVENLKIDGQSNLQICRYSDNSRIGVATLEAGRLSEDNKKLNKALNF